LSEVEGDALAQPLDYCNPVVQSRVGRKETASSTTGGAADPGKRIDQVFPRVAGPLQNRNRMTVRSVFFVAAVTARNQLSGNRRQCSRSGEELLQTGRQDAESGTENLRFGDMTEILVREFMSQNPAQLIIGCPGVTVLWLHRIRNCRRWRH
jgi:hypothetical protein